MFKLIPLSQVLRSSSFRIDNALIEQGIQISGIYREIHGANVSSHIGTDSYLKKLDDNWYSNCYERNNLLVLNGSRTVNLFCKYTNQEMTFTITPDNIYKNNKLYYGSPGIISWYGDIYHKTKSGNEGSISINFTENAYSIEEIKEIEKEKEEKYIFMNLS